MLDDGATSALAGTRFRDVRWHAEIDSTNRALLDLARSGAPEGVVVAADHQTAGRGRLGRTWTAPPGSSLLVSVLLRPRLAADRVHLVTAAVALAAADACADVAGFRPGLKWPNDLVATAPGGGERKLAGILAEADVDEAGVRFVVAGLGLNVDWTGRPPADVAATAVAARQVAGREVERLALLVRLLQALEGHYARLARPDGEAAVADAYRHRCSTLGRRVGVELAEGGVTGRAVDLTGAGHLVVEDDDGTRRTVTAGDVVHLRPA